MQTRRIMMGDSRESAEYIRESSSTRNFISRKDVIVRRPASVRKKTISVTSYKYINRYHRGCRNCKEVEETRGWMGHETKQVNGVANRGQHHEWCFISLLPTLLHGGVVCTCACASRPASLHLRLFLASAYSFRDRTSGK